MLLLLTALGGAHAATVTFYTTSANHTDARDLLMSEGAPQGGEYGGLEAGSPNPLIDGPDFAPFVVLGVPALNAATLGDRLATLVDMGGTVIEVPFTLTGAVALGGRWATEGYGALTVTGGAMGTEHYLPSAPSGSRLFEGVRGLTNGPDGWEGTGVSLASGAVVHGVWDDGSPILAVRQVGAGRVITLNFWPGSKLANPGWLDTDNDAPDLVANLAWFAEGVGSLTMDVDQSGTVGAPFWLVVDSGGTPYGNWALLHAYDTGSTPIPGGVCAGVSTGLSNPRLARTGGFDSSGYGAVLVNPGPQARYRRWAVVDMSTCEVSEAHWLR